MNMTRDKLNTLIQQKNERLERDALHSAEQLIDSIAAEQKRIVEANERIAKLREELKQLSISQMDAEAILGE
jgi:DNA repair exonuclease SbcCD ATPase subunit